MRISRFFIDRPIFAAVVSLVFVIVGAVSYGRLPVAQYPEIAPPVINVTGQYPGASASVVADTVVAPLEQQINGVENMLYVTSNSTGDGRFSIAVTFELGTNLDIAQVQVQNRVAVAQPRLPSDVRNIGVTVDQGLARPDDGRAPLFARQVARHAVHLQLRQHPRHRCAEPHQRHRLDLGVRRPRLLDARVARSRPAAVAGADGGGCRRRLAGAERAGGVRRAEPAAGGAAARVSGRGADAGAARRSGRVLQHPGQADADGGGAPEGRGAGGARRARLHHQLLSRPRSGRGARHLPAAGLQRAGDGQGHPDHHGRARQGFSRGAQVHDRLQPDRVHPAVRQRRDRDHRRGGAAGRAGGDPVPADLARGRHPDHRHSGVAGRHLLLHGHVRLLAQQPVAVRAGAGDRHRRGRRHRRGGERRAQYRGGPHADRGGAAHHGRGGRGADRHRARAVRGVRAGSLHHRHLRAVLPPVRADHCRRHDHLADRLPHAVAGALRAAAQAAWGGGPAPLVDTARAWLLRRLQSGLRGAGRRLRLAHRAPGAGRRADAGRVRRRDRLRPQRVPQGAGGLHPAARRRLPDRGDAAAGRRVARPAPTRSTGGWWTSPCRCRASRTP